MTTRSNWFKGESWTMFTGLLRPPSRWRCKHTLADSDAVSQHHRGWKICLQRPSIKYVKTEFNYKSSDSELLMTSRPELQPVPCFLSHTFIVYPGGSCFIFNDHSFLHCLITHISIHMFHEQAVALLSLVWSINHLSFIVHIRSCLHQ